MKVYMINLDLINTNIDVSNNLTNEEFKQLANFVYTLEEFEKEFNNTDMTSNVDTNSCLIRILED